MTRLLVIVPCRDEGAVIERRLANLAWSVWPASLQPHRVLVVDDGSMDETSRLAQAAGARVFDPALVQYETLSNTTAPGKSGAVRTALARAASECDVVVLTDADVVHDAQALVEVAQAFERDAKLALACAAQTFVERLPTDGRVGSSLVDAGQPFDHATAWVRACESRAGVLWSLHGQLCAWRSSLRLAPSLGVAADDLDLVGQVRARATGPCAVRVVGAARFFEVKSSGPVAAGQALRRARAYFQAMQRRAPEAGGPLRQAQAWAYRTLPGWAPLAPRVLQVGLCALAALWGGFMAALACATVLSLCAAIPVCRYWLELLRTIARARQLERSSSLSDRWSMQRT